MPEKSSVQKNIFLDQALLNYFKDGHFPGLQEVHELLHRTIKKICEDSRDIEPDINSSLFYNDEEALIILRAALAHEFISPEKLEYYKAKVEGVWEQTEFFSDIYMNDPDKKIQLELLRTRAATYEAIIQYASNDPFIDCLVTLALSDLGGKVLTENLPGLDQYYSP